MLLDFVYVFKKYEQKVKKYLNNGHKYSMSNDNNKHSDVQNKEVGGQENDKNKNKPNTFGGCCCSWCGRCFVCNNLMCRLIFVKYGEYRRWYRKHFGEDTAYWFILLVFREIIEIAFQSFALLYYNGLNYFNPNDRILAYKTNDVLLFSVLLGLNGIFVGLLWLMYVFEGNLCRGAFFKYLFFLIDSIFDTFYALFPIFVIARQTNYNLRIAIGALQTANVYAYVPHDF